MEYWNNALPFFHHSSIPFFKLFVILAKLTNDESCFFNV